MLSLKTARALEKKGGPSSTIKRHALPRVHAECNSVLQSARPRVLHSAGGLYITLIQNR
jgi:deoxycytidylate deaminase